MAVVGTSTTTASTAKLISLRHARYHAGLGGLLRFTAMFTTGVAATEQYVGLADETGSSAAFKNGLMVGYDGDTFGFHRFVNDAKVSVAQSSWDNVPASFDPTKLNVYYIQFQYLGAGRINLFVENPVTGDMDLAHSIIYAGLNTTPSMYNPNFEFTMWAANKATSSDLVVKSASYAFFVEGKSFPTELHQPLQSSGVQQKTSVTTEVAIFTIGNKTSYASKTNFIDIVIELVTASIEASSANNLGQIRLVKNASLGGTPSYSDINANNSVVEIDTAGTTVTGGVEIFPSALAGKNDKIAANVKVHEIILAPGETLTVAGLSANSATIDAAVLWRELF
jgi:hypothetical protein